MQITAPAFVAGALAVASLAAVVLHPARRAPRIFGWVFVVAVCGLLASCLAGCATSYGLEPPARYRGNAMAVVMLHWPEDIPRICAGALVLGETDGQGKSGPILGCYKDGVIHAPNPSVNPQLTGEVIRHEFGHVLGWPANHPK